MVNRVQQQTLMPIRYAQVRAARIEERVEDQQSSLRIARSVIAALRKIPTEPQQALRSNRGGRAVDRLELIERIGRTMTPVAER